MIVAVDDNIILRQLLTLTLSTIAMDDDLLSFKVFSSCDEALNYAEHYQVDLFIIDWYMPVFSGNDLIKNLRSHLKYKNTPIIVLSGENDPEVKTEAKSLGATGWLLKPFNPHSLKILIYKLLGRYCCLNVLMPDHYDVFRK